MSFVTLTHLTIINKPSESNKCLLKVSLLETSQGISTKIDNDNFGIKMLITDYIGQDYEYMIFVTRSKFLHVHQNITKNSKDAPITQIPLLTLTDIKSEASIKHKRSEESDQFIDVKFTNINNNRLEANETNLIEPNQELEKLIKKNRLQKNFT
ncbi:1479_t:CDS:2 [Cetraspora pellucida]|uniref:1479_t:CDS:1 n=1 Tax=Cetraspora pellucida TaxID=1433469 RepID=A0ACA9N448_9GLOM|nr:1479_t:CDS:2 [Cetraspora pellucida]